MLVARLLVQDINLPGLDGLSATIRIRRFNQIVPIVSMTAISGPREVSQYLANGINDILSKPFTPTSLLAILHRFCHP